MNPICPAASKNWLEGTTGERKWFVMAQYGAQEGAARSIQPLAGYLFGAVYLVVGLAAPKVTAAT